MTTASRVLPIPMCLSLGFFLALIGLELSSAFMVTTSTSSAAMRRNWDEVDRRRPTHRQQLRQQRRRWRDPVTTMAATAASAVFGNDVAITKSKILQLAAVMERGGMANPGVSNAYLSTKEDMQLLVETLADMAPVNQPLGAAQLSGRWELVYTTVELFRASPFFQMVEAGYDDPEKSNLFFKLHQLQTGSWGASSIGRITQVIDLIDETDSAGLGYAEALSGEAVGDTTAAIEATPSGGSGSLESEVDLIILPLTSVPLVGFWKLLPTFGGCIATKAQCSLAGDNNEVVQLVVESTKLKAVEDVPLLPLAGSFFEGKDFPTGEVAKQVMGNVPVTKQTVVYIDEGLRVMQDKAGELYIYARPLERY